MVDFVSRRFKCFFEDMAKGIHEFGIHNFKVALTNTEPDVLEDTELSHIDAIDLTNVPEVGDTLEDSLLVEDEQTRWLVNQRITTATGAVPAFRYVVVYNDSISPKRLCWYYRLPDSITLAANDQFLFEFSAAGALVLL